MKRRYLFAVAVLLLFGAVRLPFEQALTAEHRRNFFHGAQLDLGLRQRIGQLAFLAALSGFRSLVADALWIQAHSAWERLEWGRMALLFNSVTALQPRAVLFWDMAAWHMAWNASVAALEDPRIPNRPLRLRAQREYFDLGRDFLQRGIENNPDRWELRDRMALLLKDKYKDHCAAADQYAAAENLPGAPDYMHRFVAYEMAACPGREHEAYARLKKLYLEGEKNRLPTLLRWLGELQEKLNVPDRERVYTPTA